MRRNDYCHDWLLIPEDLLTSVASAAPGHRSHYCAADLPGQLHDAKEGTSSTLWIIGDRSIQKPQIKILAEVIVAHALCSDPDIEGFDVRMSTAVQLYAPIEGTSVRDSGRNVKLPQTEILQNFKVIGFLPELFLIRFEVSLACLVSLV
eukprot:s4715_g1.t1